MIRQIVREHVVRRSFISLGFLQLVWVLSVAFPILPCRSPNAKDVRVRQRSIIYDYGSCNQCRMAVSDNSFEDWRRTPRDFETLETWAVENGMLLEQGFTLTNSAASHDDYDDWNVQLKQSAEEADRILFIPQSLIFSAARIEKELEHLQGFDNATDYITSRNCQDQLPQFYLWIKIIQEFQKGVDSKWYAWFQSLPRHFGNALSMDDVELEFLPPYAWSLAKLQLLHLEVFPEALARLDLRTNSTLSDAAISPIDTELAKWALSVVFTRCWGEEDDDTGKYCHVAPVGDMLNHDSNASTFLHYDDEENCNIFLKHDIAPGSSLSLSYGRTTNPSRFLVLYGFVDVNQPTIFSQILATNPSQKHKDLGYDVSKMVFHTKDGSISEEVMDVTLYSILEQVPTLQQQFYESRMRNNTLVASNLREQYHLEVCIVLKKHVDGKLLEIQTLLRDMDSIMRNKDTSEIEAMVIQEHPRLPAIYEHNQFLYFTFLKVKQRIDGMIQQEMKKRQSK